MLLGSFLLPGAPRGPDAPQDPAAAFTSCPRAKCQLRGHLIAFLIFVAELFILREFTGNSKNTEDPVSPSPSSVCLHHTACPQHKVCREIDAGERGGTSHFQDGASYFFFYIYIFLDHDEIYVRFKS